MRIEKHKEGEKTYNYIQQSNKFPLDIGKWGHIPEQIENLLNIDNNNCDKTPCLLRYGIENSKKQSFLSAMASVYNYAVHMHVTKTPNGTPITIPTEERLKHLSLDTFKKYIITSLNLDIFNKLHNGNLVDIFSSTKNVSLDKVEYKSTELYKKLIDKKSNKILQLIVNSYENFKKYIMSDKYINYTYLWDLFITPNEKLFFNGINIVILEINGIDETQNVKLVCPTSYYSDKNFYIDNNTCILIKYGDYYEPLYRQYDHSSISFTFSTFKYDDIQLSDFFIKIKELYESKEKCLPFQIFENSDTYKIYTSTKIIKILETYKVEILSQVIDIFGKVNGIVITLDSNNIQYIPCFPSNINMKYDIIFTGDFEFNNYEKTVQNLNIINDLTSKELKCLLAKNIVDTIKNKKYIVGILTELNLFVPINDIVENTIDEVPEEKNKHVYIDKNMKINISNTNESTSVSNSYLKNNIELETLFYNRFKILIRNRLNNNKILQGRIFDIIKSPDINYTIKQQKVYNEIDKLIDDIIIFTDEDTLLNCIHRANLLEYKEKDCFEKNKKQLLPKENLITKKNNKFVYTLKLIDEMIRTQHGLYFFEVPNKYFSYINNFNFETHNNEIIISQNELPRLYSEKQKINNNIYNENISYEFANPIIDKQIENKVTIKINKTKKKYEKQRDIETAAHKQTKKNRRPRCPKGMRRNRKTGICEPM